MKKYRTTAHIVLYFFSLLNFACFSMGQSHAQGADITRVRVDGREGAYTFSVTIQSPDTGCDQYADWWEVVTESGELIYRRILLHSHVNEQPFTRSGGPVSVKKDRRILVRAHMNNDGYGGMVAAGSVKEGFEIMQLTRDFAVDLAGKEPLPEGCGF